MSDNENYLDDVDIDLDQFMINNAELIDSDNDNNELANFYENIQPGSNTPEFIQFVDSQENGNSTVDPPFTMDEIRDLSNKLAILYGIQSPSNVPEFTQFVDSVNQATNLGLRVPKPSKSQKPKPSTRVTRGRSKPATRRQSPRNISPKRLRSGRIYSSSVNRNGSPPRQIIRSQSPSDRSQSPSGSQHRSPSPPRSQIRSSSPPRLLQTATNAPRNRPEPRIMKRFAESYGDNELVIKIDRQIKNRQRGRIPNKACRYLLSQCSRRFPTRRDKKLRDTKVNVRKRRIRRRV
ncbi:hypothetical protein AVEN_167036-1 [Araneus ventricosus]|uniref:Uncharacterized protein n=1 Tax=Araneus ventricosus TaxID=182803 RepID=A0A4Y2SLH6_ARAVE|nr:hypothetical protein AVEN_167036-1 [Araneus ventricosus]